MKTAALAIALVLRAADSQAPAPVESGSAGCWELCRHAKGLGSSACMTECKMYTDVAPNTDEALKAFVEDETVNEAGGEDMERAYEKMSEERVRSCVPQFEGSPKFTDIDANGDSVISKSEIIGFAKKMCVSDEMIRQMFHEADRNQDGDVNPIEFDKGGEDTQLEEGVDMMMDTHTGGDDEYNPVKLPALEAFDADGDKKLSKEELRDALFFEHNQRFSKTATKKELREWAEAQKDVLESLLFLLDTDGDGKISEDEYNTMDLHDHLGGEMKEAQDANHDGVDPDNLRRMEHPTAAPLPADYFGHDAVPAPAAGAVGMLARRRGGSAWQRFFAGQRRLAATRGGRRFLGARHKAPCLCPAGQEQLVQAMRNLRMHYTAWVQRQRVVEGGRGEDVRLPAAAQMKAGFNRIAKEAAQVGYRVALLRESCPEGGCRSPQEVRVWEEGLRQVAAGANRRLSRLARREAHKMHWDSERSTWETMQSLTTVLQGIYDGAEGLARPYEQRQCPCRA